MICAAGRIYDKKHPTCRTCQIGCVMKVTEPSNSGKQLSENTGQLKSSKHKGPNKTELEYATRLGYEFPGCKPLFEGLKLKLATDQVYSPDWVVRLTDGQILCVEVKNAAYQHASYGRSKMAFNYAKLEWPFKFRWAEKTKEGWDVSDY